MCAHSRSGSSPELETASNAEEGMVEWGQRFCQEGKSGSKLLCHINRLGEGHIIIFYVFKDFIYS